HERHRMTYGHANPEEPVQLVNARVSAVGKLAALYLGRRAATPSAASTPTARGAYFRETSLVRCPVYARAGVEPGIGRAGPLISEAMDTTIVVPPRWHCRGDADGSIALEADR